MDTTLQSEQDVKYIEEVQDLHFNFNITLGKERCEAILKERPELYQVRTFYAFFLEYVDPKQSLKQFMQVFNEQPYYFENTSYLLDNIIYLFQQYGRDFVKKIEKQYFEYEGEKDGFYYICIALLQRLNKDYEKSLETLTTKVLDYSGQPRVQAWFFHQLGCHYQNETYFGNDISSEPYATSVRYFEKGLELQPNHKMNYQNLGVLLHDTDNDKYKPKCLEYFNKSLEISSQDPGCKAQVSNTYMSMGEFQKAFDILRPLMHNLKFIYILTYYMPLLTDFQERCEFDDVGQIFSETCQGLQSVLSVESYSDDIFSLFQNLQIITIQQGFQLKYTALIDSLVEEFREQNPLALVALKSYLDKNCFVKDEENVNYGANNKLHPIERISDLLINKQISLATNILSLIAYCKDIPQILSFQSSYSHWDLLIGDETL